MPQLVAALKSNQPAAQRAAAEALGRVGDRRAVPDLLAVAASPLDRALEHSVTYALIEIADPTSTATGLQASSSRAKRVALIALDQMDGGGLKPEAVISLFASTDPLLKETAWWIAGHHQDWGGALAAFFKNELSSTRLSATERDDLQQKLVQFGENRAIQDLLGTMVDGAVSKDDRLIALRAMSKTRAKEMPASWLAPIVRALSAEDVDLTRQALSVARAVPVSQLAAAELTTVLQGSPAMAAHRLICASKRSLLFLAVCPASIRIRSMPCALVSNPRKRQPYEWPRQALSKKPSSIVSSWWPWRG